MLCTNELAIHSYNAKSSTSMVESHCLVLVESFSFENLSMIESCPLFWMGILGFLS